MSSSFESPAVLELERVPLEELQPLAMELGIFGEWSRHLRSPEASDEEWKTALRSVVRDYLDFRPVAGDEQFERCVRSRKFFESAIAWLIVDNSHAVERLCAGFEHLEREVRQLRCNDEGSLLPDQSLAAWKLDADFHRLFCESAHCQHFAAIVNKVWEKYRDSGRPRTVDELEKTWAEHRDIVDAIKVAHPRNRDSLNRIYSAIFRHIDNARGRWQRHCMDAANLANLMGRFEKRGSEDRRKGQEAFTRQLPDLLSEHLGQWVLYVGEHCRGFFATQGEAYQLCERLSVSRDSFIVRQVLPPVDEPCGVS